MGNAYPISGNTPRHFFINTYLTHPSVITLNIFDGLRTGCWVHFHFSIACRLIIDYFIRSINKFTSLIINGSDRWRASIRSGREIFSHEFNEAVKLIGVVVG